MRALERQAWIGEFDPLDGVILHEPEGGPNAEQPTLEEVGRPQLAAE
jgi:hypothetical protein